MRRVECAVTGWVKPLRHWRAERALGLKELAARAGVSHSTILRIERGQTLSQPRVYRKLAQALGIEPLQIAEYRRLMGIEAEEERDGKEAGPR